MNSGETRLAGVMGWPVAHSKSPRLHGFWLRQLNVDGAYLPLPVAPEKLLDAVTGLQALLRLLPWTVSATQEWGRLWFS